MMAVLFRPAWGLALFLILLLTASARGDDPIAPAAPIAPERFKVAIGYSPQSGPATARVTVVEFFDYQCPFCGRVQATLEQIRTTYGKDVRFVYKHNPLPFHPNAAPAARAALAALDQGSEKFSQYHQLLFQNQAQLSEATYTDLARRAGLDVKRFQRDLVQNQARYDQLIAGDQADAERLGSRGTPSFFINGRPFSGAQPFDRFKELIDEELAAADKVLQGDVGPAQLYAMLIQNGKEQVPPPPPPAPPAVDPTVYRAVLGSAPQKGPRNARVTIVEYSDFQCPFCGRITPTLARLLAAYPKDVRLVFKQLPLPFHNDAHLAAEASLAAGAQGKFWEMHDKLYVNQQALKREDLVGYAKELGLDAERFSAALDAGTYRDAVDHDAAEGNRIGARGTPTFFINGKLLVGAQPYETFQIRVDEALKEADALLKKRHLAVSKLYDALMKDAKDAPADKDQAAQDKTVYKVDPGQGPSWGPPKAQVTIVVFSDFQCPFCSRTLPTLKQIRDKYPTQVRLVWRNFPLPFHDKAQLAAEAALAAGAQGKFWEMHDKLFASQQALDQPSLVLYAQEIGLDVGRFKTDLEGGTYKAAVQADIDYGKSLKSESLGTPTFFINGRLLSGAQPFPAFDSIIQEELNRKPAKKTGAKAHTAPR